LTSLFCLPSYFYLILRFARYASPSFNTLFVSLSFFLSLFFSVPKAKAETPMEQWSQKCASWLVGRDGGSYDRLEHLKEKDQEEGGVSPMWVPPNDSSNSGGGGDSVTSPNSGLSGNSTVEEGEPASPGSGNGSPLSSPSSAQNNHKELLGGVSGQALPGELLLVMGPSGAGKTTLLQILSGHKRAGSGLASGSVHVNGHARQASDGRWRWTGNQPTCSDSGSNGRSSSSTVSASLMHEGMTEHPSKPPITALPSWAYVSQDHDVHVGVLTVRETIEFAVALRLTLPEASGAMSQGAKAQLRRNRAALLLDLLGLTALEHVLVGGSSSSNSGGGRGSGLSGGETKRVTIAVELVFYCATSCLDRNYLFF
jgi:ABC-type multidrug transport system ATPase subunit